MFKPYINKWASNLKNIRKSNKNDLGRIGEILVFNYRLYFYPIFKNDNYYFKELQVPGVIKEYESLVDKMFVYDDSIVKGFMQVKGSKLEKLFVEPIFHNNSIGSKLLKYAIEKLCIDHLWVLEKNIKAISFYERHGFNKTSSKKYEDGTTEFLVRLER